MKTREPLLEVVTVPAAVLRRKARPATPGPELAEFAARMIVTAKEHPRGGVGLAAPQVGKSIRLIVWKSAAHQSWRALANPRLAETRGSGVRSEGCLSVPRIERVISRAEWVRVTGQDVETGEPVEIEVRGPEARILQHECDHLNGRLLGRRA